MKRTLSFITALLLVPTAAAFGQNALPVLSATYPIPDVIQSLGSSAPEELRMFRGFAIEEIASFDDEKIPDRTSEGVFKNTPLFDNKLPEGRLFNCTVQIIIDNPIPSNEWWRR